MKMCKQHGVYDWDTELTDRTQNKLRLPLLEDPDDLVCPSVFELYELEGPRESFSFETWWNNSRLQSKLYKTTIIIYR